MSLFCTFPGLVYGIDFYGFWEGVHEFDQAGVVFFGYSFVEVGDKQAREQAYEEFSHLLFDGFFVDVKNGQISDDN